jgi:hypothetical protein
VWSWPFTTIQCWGQEWWRYTATPQHTFITCCLSN